MPEFTFDEADLDAREAQNEADIDRLTCDFANGVREAETAVSEALAAVGVLVSNEVYDVELAEGPEGDDAIRELGLAANALRNAGRIAKWRRGALLAADARMSER
jgi:hypothetical protein